MVGSRTIAFFVSATAVALAPALVPAWAPTWTRAQAHAAPSDCDGDAVVGRFRRVGSGASFDYKGRTVELQNESALDTYSRAEIKSGRQSGDLVWIDRSRRRFGLSAHGIIDHDTASAEGWKQCGPFSGKRTQSVINSVFAARACARIAGESRCGAWYVD